MKNPNELDICRKKTQLKEENDSFKKQMINIQEDLTLRRGGRIKNHVDTKQQMVF